MKKLLLVLLLIFAVVIGISLLSQPVTGWDLLILDCDHNPQSDPHHFISIDEAKFFANKLLAQNIGSIIYLSNETRPDIVISQGCPDEQYPIWTVVAND